MKLYGLTVVFAVGVLSVIPSAPAYAQAKPGTLTIVQEDTPKVGAREQYEAGRKQLVAWHRSVKDPDPLVVFETVTGENKGNYIVTRQRGLHWADLDKDLAAGAQQRAEFQKAMGDSRAKVVTRMYEEVPELDHSTGSANGGPAKYYEIDTFHVPLGKMDRFAAAVGRLREAIEKTKSPMNVSWLVLTEGGEFGTWVAAIGHDSWADFGSPEPDEVLKNAFGSAEANAILNEISALTGGHFTEEVIEFRPDLSYFPKK